MINYKKIVEDLQDEKIIALMESLGVSQYEDKPDFLIFPTICHNDPGDNSSLKLYYYKDSHQFMCYTNCGSMSIFKMLKAHYEHNNIEYNWFDDILEKALYVAGQSLHTLMLSSPPKPALNLQSRYPERKVPKALKHYSDTVLDVFLKTYPVEWLSEGISQASMDKYEISFSISQNKIIIPHRDVFGNLVGIKGRALDEWEIENLGKYMPVQIENQWYNHQTGLNLYGLNYNKDTIRRYGIVYVFEGEKSVLKLESLGFPALGVAVGGSSFNKFQLELLIKNARPREVVLCFDKEQIAGDNTYFNKLYKMCTQYKNLVQMSFIYDRENLLNLKDSPVDMGADVFRRLLSRRVIVK